MAGQHGWQLGAPILRSLAEEWTVPILRELSVGSLRPSELEERLPRAPHAALTRRLSELRSSGVVIRQRTGGLSPQADYSLSDSGRALMAIPDAAERWARNWSPLDSGRRPAGRLALRLTADERTRSILLSLADGPLRPAKLEERLPQIGRSAIRERLGQLEQVGILTRTDLDGHSEYSLTPSARRLSLTVMLAGHWERQWTRDGDESDSGDPFSLLRLLAPLVKTPVLVAGVCRLHCLSRGSGDDIYLVAKHGQLAVTKTASMPPQALGWASPESWYDALLHEHLGSIKTSGNAGLMESLLGNVTAALVA
jgi:DNA-binding HxlR family transcriptional regulator